MKDEKTLKERQNLLLIGLFFLSMAAVFVMYGLEKNLKGAYRTGILACVLLVPLWVFLRNTDRNQERYKKILVPAWGIFGFTMLLVLLSVHVDTYFFWIGGSVCLTALFPSAAGIGFSLFFWCMFCFSASAEVSYEMFALFLGIILCGSVFFLKKKKPLILVIVIALILYTLLFFVMTNGSRAYFEIPSIAAMAGVVADLVLAKLLYDRIFLWEEKMFGRVVKGDFPLLVSLRQYSKTLCVHCVDVSELSFRAAKLLGCDERLCRTGGLYHEAGQILGQPPENCISGSIALMKKFHFPERAVLLVQQLSGDYGIPDMKEAVIVALTDKVLTSIDYLEKRKKKNNAMLEKLLDRLFEKKQQEGVFENAGFSEKEIEELKKFYLENSF